MIDIHVFHDGAKHQTVIKTTVTGKSTPEDVCKRVLDRITLMVPPAIALEEGNIIPCNDCAKYEYCFWYECCKEDIEMGRGLHHFQKKDNPKKKERKCSS